ncbi:MULTISPECIES: response regulator transcription factor [Carnobacterium]|uniref:DNA-binding response regulator n=1 Tax=Carnobacterium divergens TaxID=2748 RepID=A0A2R7ZY20_CARDV|nr:MULTISPECIES: response regulator transcription factor [Carnobacterium]MPQ22289.1 response regulator transcription factor [Carnobacterium divergens]TFI65131.1 DNA-binding response regulator [Carnobacterium divergens]TFI75432.1 DNA-binding response regulator [Carnobacterium divergens]TFI76495.1 DNA-binding response regulator [Carnobacterium divergens]TFI80040.1 DNA-binding response regulator [Carnobacterium divergens]
MKRVLIVDDEESILTLLAFNLEKAGYDVQTATDGLEGYELALKNKYAFIILDLMLPSMDGMEVCKKLRQEKIETPIMILTAKDDELEKIIGLELGADDYMTKPFSPREVLARMKAIMRRVHSKGKVEEEKENLKEELVEITIGEIKIFPELYEVIVREKPIEVTPKEFELLLYMMKRVNRILSREQLLDAIWNFDYAGETRIVDVHISHLREKIELDTKNPAYIRTVRGFGYKFEVPK